MSDHAKLNQGRLAVISLVNSLFAVEMEHDANREQKSTGTSHASRVVIYVMFFFSFIFPRSFHLFPTPFPPSLLFSGGENGKEHDLFSSTMAMYV